VTSYSLVVPATSGGVSLTASVADAARTALTIDGVAVASGAPGPRAARPFHPLVVHVEAGGRARSYNRYRRDAGLDVPQAQQLRELDGVRLAAALSGDGSTLAVGAMGEGSTRPGRAASTSSARRRRVEPAGRAPGLDTTSAHRTSAGSWSLSTDALGPRGSVRTDAESITGLKTGKVYVFERSGTTWTETARLVASNAGERDFFGAVALSGDGTTIAVGAPTEDSSAKGIGGDPTNDDALDSGGLRLRPHRRPLGRGSLHQASNANAIDASGRTWALSS